MASFTAFYDADVLYGSQLRNLMMHLAMTGLFRARWSADVHEEWMTALRNCLKRFMPTRADAGFQPRRLPASSERIKLTF